MVGEFEDCPRKRYPADYVSLQCYPDEDLKLDAVAMSSARIGCSFRALGTMTDTGLHSDLDGTSLVVTTSLYAFLWTISVQITAPANIAVPETLSHSIT